MQKTLQSDWEAQFEDLLARFSSIPPQYVMGVAFSFFCRRERSSDHQRRIPEHVCYLVFGITRKKKRRTQTLSETAQFRVVTASFVVLPRPATALCGSY